MNPVTYLLVSLELSSLVLTAIFFIAWLSFGRRPHALLWSLAFFFAAVQWGLNLSSQRLALPFEVYWLLVSLASALTLSLALAGFRMRAGLPTRAWWYVVVGIVDLGAIAWFLIVDPHTGLRTAIGPLYAALMLVGCIHAIAHLRDRQPADWGTMISIGLFALCEVAAAVAILGGGAAGTQASLDTYRMINFLSLPSAYIGMGLFTVLILASDMSKEMKALALCDPLTGLLNLRGFHDAATRALSSARRKGGVVSVIVCDIDHFKTINDRHGHAVGDEALIRFATHLRRSVREYDVVGRVGGEEFALLLPDASLADAAAAAELLRTTMSALAFERGDSRIDIQASFGVATFGGSEESIAQVIEHADDALYRSKREGRNRVSVADGTTSSVAAA